MDTLRRIEVVKVFFIESEMLGVPMTWLILKTRPQKRTTISTWVFLKKVFETLINKHDEKKTSSHIITFPRTNINSKIHRWIEKARQERHCNTKINVINRSNHSPKSTPLTERVWEILKMFFLTCKEMFYYGQPLFLLRPQMIRR